MSSCSAVSSNSQSCDATDLFVDQQLDHINSTTAQSNKLCESGRSSGVLTLFCSRVAQTCHDDRVVELKEQLVVEEVDGEGQDRKGKGRRERSSQRERVMDGMKMIMNGLRT